MRRSLLCTFGLWLMALASPVSVLQVGSTVTAAPPNRFLGSDSCATSTCHGGVVGQGPSWHHSLSTWVANDPHAGAGLLLRDQDSRAIVVRLNRQAAQSPEAFDNVLRSRCISCHATPTPEQCSDEGLLDDAFLAAGVSCEACHGAAESWLQPHVQVDWAGPSGGGASGETDPRFDPATGMIDTESILGRAETCVRCHIGSRTKDGLIRDMNHDLVAAGHPALRFDLLLYNENLPKHWDTNSEVASKFNESAVRVRRVGRAVNLAAAASLSAERASAHIADRGSAPWPELADYDCFACHQSLSIREYRLPPSDQSKSPLHVSDGLPIWNAWHTINQLDLRDDRKTLEALSPHRSDPQRIAQSVPKLAAKYRQEAIGRMTEDIDSRDAVKIPLTQLQTAPPVDWHQAAIQYLDLDAGLRDLARDPATAQQAIKFLQSLGDCEVMLRFDASEGSPNYDSPKAFDPDAFRDRVLSIFQVKPLQPSRAANNPNN